MKIILRSYTFPKYLLLCLPYWQQSNKDKNLSLTNLQYKRKIRATGAAELFPATDFHSELSSEALEVGLVLQTETLNHFWTAHSNMADAYLCLAEERLIPVLNWNLHTPLYPNLIAFSHIQRLKVHSSGELLKWEGWSC